MKRVALFCEECSHAVVYRDRSGAIAAWLTFHVAHATGDNNVTACDQQDCDPEATTWDDRPGALGARGGK